MTTVTTIDFGTRPEGVGHRYILTNAKGWTVELTDMGAAIRGVWIPDKDGKLVDVVLNHASFEDSVINSGSYGSICGRVANRISGAAFTLNGKEYKLASKIPDYQLHGGPVNFSHKLWSTTVLPNGSIEFSLVSPDGDQGFPGTVTVFVTYTWDDEGRLSIDYHATSDADTVVNLTNHAYFNLNGHGDGVIDNHLCMMPCESYLSVNEHVCVTGDICPVKGTVMDFTTPHTLGERLHADDPQLNAAKGYDHSFVLPTGTGVRHCARVIGDKTGICLDAYTDKPAVHLYAGCNMRPIGGKDGCTYNQYGAFCLETQ